MTWTIYIITVVIALVTKWYWEKNGSSDNMYTQMKKDMLKNLCDDRHTDVGEIGVILFVYAFLILMPVFNLVSPIWSIIIVAWDKVIQKLDADARKKASKVLMKVLYNKDCEDTKDSEK